MDNVKRYSSFIKRIVTTNNEVIRTKLLKTCNLKIITAISEIVYNIIYKNIKVNSAVINKLKKFKKIFHKLIAQSTTAGERRTILVNNSKSLKSLSVLFK